ncbi:hypothetical protein RJ640_015150 [Escallonia rubra]|uniref:NADP-dependent oxidoreductase domain-containing protein n=1 Tax=Escallonia rubra TaxID=112253 RepID=A0AA88UTA3_9ASTE|nr:hypothetical protein RJ640_015150 [Escallonia rubra]
MATVGRIKLGSQGLDVSAQGLGCMGMSFMYGPPKPESDMIDLIHHAVNTGVTFLDTSDFYGPHTNEILIGKALKGGWREKVQLATKFGITEEDGKMAIRGDPAYVRAACMGSLNRLDIDCIDLYYAHRIDNRVPIEVTAFVFDLKHPDGRRNAGGMHHHRILFDKNHLGYFVKVGMGYFHRLRNKFHCPVVNAEHLWSLVPQEAREKAAAAAPNLIINFVKKIKNNGFFRSNNINTYTIHIKDCIIVISFTIAIMTGVFMVRTVVRRAVGAIDVSINVIEFQGMIIFRI